ncbi:EAL domain-containing protein [Bacillus tianshenii]|nr:EAL domain-containing protein [Bacillus tianshenii]
MNNLHLTYEEECRSIIENHNLTTVYQPIVSLNEAAVFGLEALTRGPINSELHFPIKLFSIAEQLNLLYPLEKCARESAIAKVHPHRKNQEKLFLNLSARVIHDPTFTPGQTIEMVQAHGLEPKDIVFEITERHAIDDFATFRKALNHYRNQGFQIAVDDAGAGYSSALAISELAPEYIKIDRGLIDGVSTSSVKESILEAFVTIAKRMNSYVIAEGIETTADLAKVIELGFDYGQGYLFARPGNPVQPVPLSVSDSIKQYHAQKNDKPIAVLASPAQTFSITTSLEAVKTFFSNKQIF